MKISRTHHITRKGVVKRNPRDYNRPINQIEDNFIRLDKGWQCKGCREYFRTIKACNDHLDTLEKGAV